MSAPAQHPELPTSFLIQITGEDIDFPLTAVVPDWEGVRQFCIEHYTGSADHSGYDGRLTLDMLKEDFDAHEAEETGEPYSEAWEIGGLTIQRVWHAAREQDRARAAAPQAAVGVSDEREAFKAAHANLDLTEVPDAWNRPKFAHSHVDAMWAGWLKRAVLALCATKPEAPALFRALLTAERDASIDVSGDIARQEAQIDLADHLLVRFNELFPEASNVRS